MPLYAARGQMGTIQGERSTAYLGEYSGYPWPSKVRNREMMLIGTTNGLEIRETISVSMGLLRR